MQFFCNSSCLFQSLYKDGSGIHAYRCDNKEDDYSSKVSEQKSCSYSDGHSIYPLLYPISLYNSSLVCILLSKSFCVPCFFNSSKAPSIAFMATLNPVMGKMTIE